MIDYHLHVWPHEPGTPTPTLELLDSYWRQAQAAGLERIAITEHSHRFVQIGSAVSGFWAAEPPALAAATAQVWATEQGADLDAYCDAVLAAQVEGLPVELGIEVDLLPGRVEAMAKVLAGYPVDVRLGSVHWLGAWLFDAYGTDVFAAEWDVRGVETAWRDYLTAFGELAGSGLGEVVAHCDLIKIARRFPDPAMRADFENRLVEVVASSGLAVEVSSAGWRKAVAEQYPSQSILEQLHQAGVEITLGSDAHVPDQVAFEYGRLVDLVRETGFTHVVAFPAGSKTPIALDPAPTA